MQLTHVASRIELLGYITSRLPCPPDPSPSHTTLPNRQRHLLFSTSSLFLARHFKATFIQRRICTDSSFDSIFATNTCNLSISYYRCCKVTLSFFIFPRSHSTNTSFRSVRHLHFTPFVLFFRSIHQRPISTRQFLDFSVSISTSQSPFLYLTQWVVEVTTKPPQYSSSTRAPTTPRFRRPPNRRPADI